MSYSITSNPITLQYDYRAMSNVHGSSVMKSVKFGADYSLLTITSGKLSMITSSTVNDLQVPVAVTNVTAFTLQDGSFTVIISGVNQVYAATIKPGNFDHFYFLLKELLTLNAQVII